FSLLIHNLRSLRNETALIVTTDDPSQGLPVEWINHGASAYALRPFDPLYILDLCSRVRRQKALFTMEELLEKRTKALKESEHRYRSLFQNNHSAMLIIDPDTGQIAEANQAAAKYYGWSVNEITSMKISDLNILSREEVLAEMEKAEKESISQFYFKHCLSSGDIRDVEVFSGPIVIEGKSMLYSIIHDITRRKQIEQELIQSNMDLKMAEEVAGMGSWKYDPENDVFTGSDGFLRIMGNRNLKQICFKEFLKLVHIEDQTEVSRVWENVLNSYQSFDFDFRLAVNQRIKCLRMVGAAQTSLDGRSVSAMGMIMDISEKKALELKKKQQQEHLAQASKMAALGTLVAGVAHEINNPNNLIMLNTPILEKVWKDSLPVLEAHQCTDTEFRIAGLPFNVMKDYTARLFSGVKEGSTRISKIVSELKDFARQSPLDMSRYVDINEVAESALTLVQKTMSKFTDNFSLNLQSDPPLILGDFQKLEQIVVNLLINAGQALDNKSQAVSLKTFHDIEQKSVGFKVIDQGIGIPAENMKRIFDPFFSTKRETGGTGLGLAISSSIIQDHHGQMYIESTPGQGTEVTVMLKLPHAGE
ncbi:MAG: ATP-binding protein, partial [Desulfonatronovibrio sp.]